MDIDTHAHDSEWWKQKETWKTIDEFQSTDCQWTYWRPWDDPLRSEPRCLSWIGRPKDEEKIVHEKNEGPISTKDQHLKWGRRARKLPATAKNIVVEHTNERSGLLEKQHPQQWF